MKQKISAKVIFNNILELLEKNRAKRPGLEEILGHKWFSSTSGPIQRMRSDSIGKTESKFRAFALTEPDSPKIS